MDLKCYRCGDWPCSCPDGQTIVHGDCREMLPLLPPVDCIVTSPPYNQLESLTTAKPSGLWASSAGGLGFVQQWKSDGYDDQMEEDDYQSWQNSLFASIKTNENASCFYNHQCRWRDGMILHPVSWFRPNGWQLRQEIIWDRAGGMMFNARMFCRFDERVLWFTRNNFHHWNQDSVGFGTVWRIPPAQNKPHPVAYPVEIPKRCISAATVRNSVVLDPFCGSGTTLVAAKQLMRRGYGIERRERYCEIAANRLRQGVLDFGEIA